MRGAGSRRRVVAAAAALIPVLLLLAAMLIAVLTISDETVRVGRRGGPWTRLPTFHAQIAASAVLGPLIAAVLWRLGVAAARLIAMPRTAPVAFALMPGETALWQGRQGWRGVDRQRLGWVMLAGVGPALYGWWLWRIWHGADPLAIRMFWSFAATCVLGGTVAPLFSPAAGRLVDDLLGVMTVTDRRIVWCTARGDVYRELPGAELITVAVVAGDAGRGWVTVTQRCGGRVSEIDLFGVPRPFEAVAAVERLMGGTSGAG